jgi:hypothetical protein
MTAAHPLIKHAAKKALKKNPNATHFDLLQEIMRATHDPAELERFYDELAAHHATHFGKHGQTNAAMKDLQKFAKGLTLVGEAIGGSHANTGSKTPEQEN